MDFEGYALINMLLACIMNKYENNMIICIKTTYHSTGFGGRSFTSADIPITL